MMSRDPKCQMEAYKVFDRALCLAGCNRFMPTEEGYVRCGYQVEVLKRCMLVKCPISP